jgi:hypothetical protein
MWLLILFGYWHYQHDFRQLAMMYDFFQLVVRLRIKHPFTNIIPTAVAARCLHCHFGKTFAAAAIHSMLLVSVSEGDADWDISSFGIYVVKKNTFENEKFEGNGGNNNKADKRTEIKKNVL